MAGASRANGASRRSGAVRTARQTRTPERGSVSKNEPARETFTCGQWLLLLGLLILAVGSGIAVVHSTHETRMRVHELRTLEARRNALQVEWGKLLLEQSSLVAQGRVAERARRELGMVIPGSRDVVMVRRQGRDME